MDSHSKRRTRITRTVGDGLNIPSIRPGSEQSWTIGAREQITSFNEAEFVENMAIFEAQVIWTKLHGQS